MNKKLYELYKNYRDSMDSQGVDYDWTSEDLLEFFNQTLWEETESEDQYIGEVTLTEWFELNKIYQKRDDYTR